MENHSDREIRKSRLLLLCGILSSLWYAALNFIVPQFWETYDSASQTVSELSAVDAPTRLLWNLLAIPYTLLVMAFGWGIARSGADNRRLHIAGMLLIIYGALGMIWPFAPMHLRETLAAGGGTFSDTVHLTLGGISELLFFLSMGFAAAGLSPAFRIYSLATFIILAIFGILTAMDAPKVSANLPTPFIGVWERINIGVFLLWIIVLAVYSGRTTILFSISLPRHPLKWKAGNAADQQTRLTVKIKAVLLRITGQTPRLMTILLSLSCFSSPLYHH